ncbi:MAG: DUF393 domain-containing protein [Bacteroidia bacterium]|nr:DUF393 domain-containing protein [Bacteroidia bacterium]
MQDKIILYFDGECVLCNKTVQWILNNEIKPVILFCPLQSEYAHSTIPDNLNEIDSVVLYYNGKHYIYLDAFIQIIPYLKWYWKILYLLLLMPPFCRRKIYNYISKNRKQWFGTTECLMNKEKLKERVLM